MAKHVLSAEKSGAPRIVRDLVAKFAEHQETYQRGDYNEALCATTS